MDSGYGPHMGSPAGVHHPPSGPMVPNSMMPPGYASPAPMPHGMGSHMPGMSPGNYSGMMPSHHQKPSSVLSVLQMKFLSAQIKAYRLLARNAPLPEQLRAFILSHASAVTATTAPSSNGTPPPTSSSSSPTPGQGNTVQPSSMTPPTSTAASSSSTVLSPTPNQQQGTSSLATDSQKTSSLPTSGATEPGQTPAQPPPAVKTEESKGEGGVLGTQPGSTPAKPQAQIRQTKLAPNAKPRGLDPEIILKEREARYSMHAHVTVM